MTARLAQAEESLREAELLLQEGMGNKIVMAKLYHALMQSLFALFRIRDLGALTHADVIDRFEAEYVRPGKFSAEQLAAIRRAYALTHECGCDPMPVTTDADVRQTMKAAAALINEVKSRLEAAQQG